jgi:hypothetical protein
MILIGTQSFYIDIDNLIFFANFFFKNSTHWLECDVATLAIKHKKDLATFGYRLTMKVEIY